MRTDRIPRGAQQALDNAGSHPQRTHSDDPGRRDHPLEGDVTKQRYGVAVDGRGRMPLIRPHLSTEYKRHSPGTPLSVRVPRSANRMPEPATRSLTVPDTSTSPGCAWAATRAPM